MRRVVKFGDRSTGGGNFRGECVCGVARPVPKLLRLSC